jgi:hypothetical protein
MPKPFTLSRRAFLVGTGGAFISLPLLEAMFTRQTLAAAASDPKRFVCMYIPNGTYMTANNGANWFPGASSAPLVAGALPVTFTPFAANTADFTILRGIANKAVGKSYNNLQASGGVGGQHACGISSFLTCGYPTDNSPVCTIAVDSFDQIVAQKNSVNGGRPLVMCGGAIGDQVADGTAFHYGEFLSYRGGKAVAPYKNPVSLYRDMFSGIVAPATPGGPATPATPQATLARNKSVLDNAVSDIARLQAKLGTSDKQKLDDYLTSLRALELKLAGPPTVVPPNTTTATGEVACVPMTAPASTMDNEDYYGNKVDFPERLQAFNDMLVLAFKCDIVRSVSITFDTEGGPRRFKNKIPASLIHQGAEMNEIEAHIGMSHYADDPAKQNRCITRDRFYLSYFFSLMNALKQANDPSGTPMLDNTVILCGHGIVDGNHNTGSTGMPMVLGGGANLGMHHGNYRALSNDMSDLLYTISGKLSLGLTNFQGSTKTITL